MSSPGNPSDSGFGSHRLQTSAPDGTLIAFDVYAGAGRSGVVIIPGFWRTRRYPALCAIASRIASELAPCAILDCRGHGESGGVFEFDRLEHFDVAAVARRFAEHSNLDRLILMGFSAGGALAISTATRHTDLTLSGLLLVSPVAEFRRVVPRPNPFTIHRHLSLGQALAKPRFRWPGIDRLSPLEDAARLALPVCLIHARNDWLVSHRHSEAIARLASNATLHILDVRGRYHADRLFEVAGERVWPIVSDFVRSAFSR
ncbi:MAG: alpha/beta fold hydrolase [Acidobacteria bacterium]|nr:alpha/beta fold hydrolase [Acidobacteriota bacterium]